MIRAATTLVTHHAAAVLDWLWPPVCPRCGARAEAPWEQYCRACWASLRPLRASEERWLLGGTDAPVPATAAFVVDALFLDLLTTSKYRRVRPVGWRLAALATDRLLHRLPPGALVPVPLTSTRRRERGFNQPEDFARRLAARTGREVAGELLRRRRGGRAVAGRPREERAAAVRGAFAARPPGGRSPAPVVLVDDVITTGSTARACLEALLGAGHAVSGVVALGRAFRVREDLPARPAGDLPERL